MTNLKPTNSLISSIRYSAPTSTLSENSGRSGGYYGGEDEETTGYSSVMIYIQLGLAEHYDLILEVVRLALAVQKGYRKKYPLLPCAFGKDSKFIHEGKYFEMGYMSDKQGDSKIADELKKLSGSVPSEKPAVLPDFFPKTDIRSLYGGKTSFDKKDFMVIIAKKGELAFAEHLENKFTADMKKRVLVVEIDEDLVNWKYRNFEIDFLSLNNRGMVMDSFKQQQLLDNVCEKTFSRLRLMYEIALKKQSANSSLIFPLYYNKEIRVSEQEARMSFAFELNELQQYFSIETPTLHEYSDFSTIEPKVYQRVNNDGRSGAIDLTIYEPDDEIKEYLQFKSIVNVEFKKGQADQKAINKDLLKLYFENAFGLWFHVIQHTKGETDNLNGTLGTLINRLNIGLDYVRIYQKNNQLNIISVINPNIMFFIVILEKDTNKNIKPLKVILDISNQKLKIDGTRIQAVLSSENI